MNNNGKELTFQEVYNIMNNYHVCKHCRLKLKTRTNYKNRKDLDNAILNYVVAYYNTDGSVNIAVDRFNYFVFVGYPKYSNWVMITFKETSGNGIDVFEKQRLAKKGVAGKYFYEKDEKWSII